MLRDIPQCTVCMCVPSSPLPFNNTQSQMGTLPHGHLKCVDGEAGEAVIHAP